MKKSYSIYEAKAHLSEIVRMVRERRETVTISYHGEPVAEIRPIELAEQPLEQRLQRMQASGELVRATSPDQKITALTRKRGALRRFLDDRD